LPAVTFNQFRLFGNFGVVGNFAFLRFLCSSAFQSFCSFANRHSRAYNSPEMLRFFHGFT
jgi:hypothetical protein